MADAEDEDAQGEEEPELAGVPKLVSPGGAIVHVAAVEVAEEDITLLSLFADALDRAAGPDAESGALAKVLAGLGEDGYPWPEGDAATVARWARSALAPAFHSPFEGSLGAADQALLSAVLDRAEGQARMVLSMTRAAAEPDEAA